MAEPKSDEQGFEEEFGAEEGRPLFTSRRRRGRFSKPPLWMVGAALGVLALVVVGVILARRPDPMASSSAANPGPGGGAGEAAADSSARPTPPSRWAEYADSTLPELDASDALVRRMAQSLSSHPALAEWLATDEIIRLFVVSVTNLARGTSPASRLEFMAPPGDFTADTIESGERIDPASYRRYDGLTAVFVSLDTEGVAELYGRLLPLMEEAYRELGLGEGSFHQVMAQAVENLRAVSVPEEPPLLEPDGAVYAFADPRLEELGSAQKQLIRMGPENARRIKDKLGELARAMGLENRP